MKDKFASYHPVINFTFFMGALICGMILLHPAYLFCSVLTSLVYHFTVRGRKGLEMLWKFLLMFVVLSLINPLFNTYGETILFTYLKDRPYTLEALYYGMALAAMMVSVLSWFASYNEVMSSDKFLYLFGRLAPSIMLIFTMVMRLIPSFKTKADQMNKARKCIGKGTDTGTGGEKLEHGMIILSSLVSWALEGGVITTDSMRNRGYGCGKRTAFSIYRFEGRDKGLLAFMTAMLGITVFCCCHGGASVRYTPSLFISGISDPYTLAGILAYFSFLFTPSAINILEEVRWHSLKSKI